MNPRRTKPPETVFEADVRNDTKRTLDDYARRFEAELEPIALAFRDGSGVSLAVAERLAIIWATSAPGFADAVLAAIDRNPSLSDVQPSERDDSVAKLDRQIVEAEAELAIRRLVVLPEQRTASTGAHGSFVGRRCATRGGAGFSAFLLAAEVLGRRPAEPSPLCGPVVCSNVHA